MSYQDPPRDDGPDGIAGTADDVAPIPAGGASFSGQAACAGF